MPKSNGWSLPTNPFEIQKIAYDKGDDQEAYGDWLEQGLGKSSLHLAEVKRGLWRDDFDCGVMIAPSYLKSGWQDEAETHQFGYPVITWPEVPTSAQMKDPFLLVMNTEATLLTPAVSREGGRFLWDLMSRRKCSLGIDESVCIANFKSNVAVSALKFAQLAKMRRLLSGLPTPETVMQWWPQLRFLGRINGVNPYAFRNRFAIMGGYMGKKVTGIRNEEELEGILTEAGIRALKIDWLDLPPKMMLPPLEFDLDPKQLAAYKSMQRDFFTAVDNGEVFADQVVHQLMKLQQISRGFIKDGDVIHELVTPDKNPAIKLLKLALANTLGKTLIFTYHEYSTRIVYEQLVAAGRNPMCLRGGLTTAEIKERKAYFNQTHECRDAVMQLSVGSKGHTMLGLPDDRCYTTIYYENMYSRDVRSQSEDRNHRIGQDSEFVNYLDLVENVPGSVTRKALIALQKKQDFVDATVNQIRLRRTN